ATASGAAAKVAVAYCWMPLSMKAPAQALLSPLASASADRSISPSLTMLAVASALSACANWRMPISTVALAHATVSLTATAPAATVKSPELLNDAFAAPDGSKTLLASAIWDRPPAVAIAFGPAAALLPTADAEALTLKVPLLSKLTSA